MKIPDELRTYVKRQYRDRDIRNAAVYTWRPLIDNKGGTVPQSEFVNSLQMMALSDTPIIHEPVEMLVEWQKAGWIEYSPDGSTIRITSSGIQQLGKWEEEDRVFRSTGAHEKIQSLINDVSNLTEENGVKVKRLVGRAEMIITQVFGKSSPYLLALRKIKFHGLPYDSIAGRDLGGPFRRGREAFTNLCEIMLEDLGPETEATSQPTSGYVQGQQFGKWTLKGEKPIGKGGNGIVWLAANSKGEMGAIKLFNREGLELRFEKSEVDNRERRFRDEVQFQTNESQRLGILPLIDSSLASSPAKTDLLWFVTPVAVPFTDLKLSGSENLSNLIQKMEVISQTLAALHMEQKWHRDLHPGNLFLLAEKPVIGDFGLVDFPGKESVTGDTEQLGARNYVAPEMRQNAGQARADKADVYSLAKTFWVLASGKPFPPDGQLRMETAELRLSTYCPHENAHILDSLMERSTAFEPARRPTMKEFSAELSEWLKIGSASPPVSSDLADLARECQGVFESGIIAEQNQQRLILAAQSTLLSFRDTLARIGGEMRRITNISPTWNDVNLYERFHIPNGFGSPNVIWRGAREARITTKIDQVEVFLHGYVQVEALNDNRLRVLVGYLVQPIILGRPGMVPDSWKEESIATVGSAQLINEIDMLKVKLIENLPKAIRDYVAAVKQQFRN